MNQSRNPFDDAATKYDAWFESKDGRVIFAQEVACLRNLMTPANGRWLEVGTGSGRFAAALSVKDGIDPSASMLALASQRGIRTIRAEGECLPFENQCFDGILMATTLCFLADPRRVLQECCRVLDDRGRLAVGLIPANSPWGRQYARKAEKGHPFYSVATFRSCDEVISLAAGVGFVLEAAFSCLLAPPDALDAAASGSEGVCDNAGFVAMAFAKCPTPGSSNLAVPR